MQLINLLFSKAQLHLSIVRVLRCTVSMHRLWREPKKAKHPSQRNMKLKLKHLD